MYKPDFPYLGNQVIISSGRVTAHSKEDMIFLFGKKGIGISTPATLNLDVGEATIIASPIIQLGYEAVEPVLLGRSTVTQLEALLDAIQELSNALSKMTAKQLEVAIPQIVKASTTLRDQTKTIKAQLNSSCLSKNTFTK